MRTYQFPENTAGTYLWVVSDLMDTKPIHTGEWQTLDTRRSEMHATHELEDVSLVWDQIPDDLTTVIPAIDLPWANEHFSERVSGQPLNPAPSHIRWPYAVRGNTDHTTDQQFDHTYPERFWPSHPMDSQGHHFDNTNRHGIRFPYGDLMDVVGLLATKPLTRQAYLPVWFPEDTGATEGQRVPCTLGYHFMQRGGRLSCRYYIRSCDVYRHLSNDVYFAAKLTAWICHQVSEMTRESTYRIAMVPGSLVMHISSLHAFVGDKQKLRDRFRKVDNDGKA